MQEKGDIKGFRGRKGFTLIELLVVVLIIGLLAAVALPQYNKAVVRAQTRKMIVDVKEIGEAQKSYYLEHGSYATKFADLDIVPSGYPSMDCSNFGVFGAKTDCISNENTVLLISNSSSGTPFALFNQGKYLRSGFMFSTATGEVRCYQYNSSKGLCTQGLNCTRDDSISNEVNNYFTCPAL